MLILQLDATETTAAEEDTADVVMVNTFLVFSCALIHIFFFTQIESVYLSIYSHDKVRNTFG